MMDAKHAALASYRNSEELTKIIKETKDKVYGMIEQAAKHGFFSAYIDFSHLEDKPWKEPLVNFIAEVLRKEGYNVYQVTWTLQVDWKNNCLNEKDIIKKIWEEN